MTSPSSDPASRSDCAISIVFVPERGTAAMPRTVQHMTDVRSDLAVTVKNAERRYPDDPSGTWQLDGLRVTVSTFSDDPSRIELRVDTPEGRGSFWETLRCVTRRPSTRPWPH